MSILCLFGLGGSGRCTVRSAWPWLLLRGVGCLVLWAWPGRLALASRLAFAWLPKLFLSILRVHLCFSLSPSPSPPPPPRAPPPQETFATCVCVCLFLFLIKSLVCGQTMASVLAVLNRCRP